MGNAIIYYCTEINEDTDQAISNIYTIVNKIEKNHVLFGVFIDSFGVSNELMELTNSPLEEIDILYLNKPIDNEFDSELIHQLGRTDHFKIKLLDEI